jgi:hypothetical protein
MRRVGERLRPGGSLHLVRQEGPEARLGLGLLLGCCRRDDLVARRSSAFGDLILAASSGGKT